MESKNLKEFPNSQIHEATLHRHPTRLSRAQTSSALLSTRSDVLTNGFVGRKKRSDIAATPPVLCLRRAQGSSAKVQTHGHISESCPKSVRCG